MMSDSAPQGLAVEDVCKEFETPTEPLVVLRNIRLHLAKGESLAILGPSGSGKSTLLQLIGTLDRPTSGSIALGGVNPFLLDENALAHYRNNQIGFVFQDHHLLPQCTLLENTLIPALAFGRPDANDRQRALELLDRVGLADRHQHRPAECSGGERQRAALARGLMMKPSLLLADEPTGNLDRRSAEQVATLLLEIQKEQHTILLLATHSQELAEKMQQQMQLIDGRLEPN